MPHDTTNNFLLGLFLLMLVFTLALSLIIPLAARRDLLFGVTVPPNTRSTPEGRRITRIYAVGVIALSVLGVVALLAIWYFHPPAWEFLLILVGVGAMVLLGFVPFLIAYFQAHALAERARAQGWRPEASAPPVAELRPRRYADYIPWWWELLPLALIGATAAYLAYTYPDAPDPFPTHFDINGNPNAFSPKTIGSYFLIVFLQIFMWALITVLTYLIVRAKSLPGRDETGFKRIVLRFLFAIKALAIGFMGVVGAASAYAAVNATALPEWFLGVTIGYIVLVFVLIIVVTVRASARSARLQPANASTTDRMDDSHWILGSIYFNRNDPSIFVERRFGIGWTINVGSVGGVLTMVALLAVAVVLPLGIVFLANQR
ncbi:MAG TPA: DUF5808 domain-containing protein [Ktedonobacterales bacterium]|jgi:uncharacterized membrane protein|nr:DUF5808 domain-containing protein [Ktedonobacterales bacterium]